MDHFWDEIKEHFQSALQNAESLENQDLKSLADIPEILSYLKGLDGNDMQLLIDHARKIKKRNRLKFNVQAGLRVELAQAEKDQRIKSLKKPEVCSLDFEKKSSLEFFFETTDCSI